MLPNLSACSVSTGSAGSNLNSRNVDAVDLAVPDRDFTDQEKRAWTMKLARMVRDVKDVDPDQPKTVEDWKSRILGHLNIAEFRMGLTQTAFVFAMLLATVEEHGDKNSELVRPLFDNWKRTNRTSEKVQFLENSLTLMLAVAQMTMAANAQNPQWQAQEA